MYEPKKILPTRSKQCLNGELRFVCHLEVFDPKFRSLR